MTLLVVGLLVGWVLGVFAGTALMIRTIYRDGFELKDGHVVSKGYKVTIDSEVAKAIAEFLRKSQ